MNMKKVFTALVSLLLCFSLCVIPMSAVSVGSISKAYNAYSQAKNIYDYEKSEPGSTERAKAGIEIAKGFESSLTNFVVTVQEIMVYGLSEYVQKKSFELFAGIARDCNTKR